MSGVQAYRGGAIATPHYLATLAGAQVLADGGNAVDAMLAANFALGVVAPYYCGYGGDLLAMVWDGGLHAFLLDFGELQRSAVPLQIRGGSITVGFIRTGIDDEQEVAPLDHFAFGEPDEIDIT